MRRISPCIFPLWFVAVNRSRDHALDQPISSAFTLQKADWEGQTSDTPLSLSTLAKQFSDEEATHELVEELRWPEGRVVCPHCGVIGRAYCLRSEDGARATRTGKVS